MHGKLGEQLDVQRPGEVSVIPAGVVHSSWTEHEAIDECVVHVDAAQLQIVCGSQALTAGIHRLDMFTDLNVTPLADCIDDARELQIIVLRFIKALIKIQPEVAVADERILRAIDAIRGGLSLPWSVKSMAKSAGMSPSNFSRRFREQVGRSPLGYLVDCRIERATWLMQSSKNPLAEIAHQVGFRSSSRFSEAFQRRRGVSPSEWRKGMVD